VKEENVVMTSASGRSEDFNCQCSPDGPDLNKSIVGNFDTWMMLSASGDKPTPRFHVIDSLISFLYTSRF